MKNVVVVAAVTLTLAACGSSSSGKTNAGPSTWTTAQAQTHYLAIRATYKDAMTSFTTDMKSGSASTMDQGCTNAAAAIDSGAKAVAAGKWPAAASADVNAFVSALSSGHALFEQCATFTAADWNGSKGQAWVAQLQSLAPTINSAGEKFRADLGLPAAG